MKMRLKDKIEWRRDQIQQLQAKGYHTVREIASILQIPRATVGKDIIYLRQEAKNNVRKYIDERLPDEYERILVGITSILREAWETSKEEEIDTKEKIQALSLAKECYSMKLDLLTNATVVSDAVKFVEAHKIVNNTNTNSEEEGTKKTSMHIEEVKEEEGTTTNQVF